MSDITKIRKDKAPTYDITACYSKGFQFGGNCICLPLLTNGDRHIIDESWRCEIPKRITVELGIIADNAEESLNADSSFEPIKLC